MNDTPQTPAPDMTPEQEDIAQAGEYTLRLMEPEEERAFEGRLATDRSLERKVAEWVFHLAPMAEGYAPKKPPKSVKKTLMIDLFGAPEKTPFMARVWPWKVLTGLALGLAAVLAVMLFLQPGPGSLPQDGEVRRIMAGDIAAEDGSLRVLVVYDAATSTLRLNQTVGAPAQGRDFQLWGIVGDTAPLSLGVLAEDGSSVIALPQELEDALEGVVLAISDEPDGGSPFSAPSGPVLATGGVSDL